MADTFLDQVQAKEAARKAREKHTQIMWLLLVGGIFLVCFASLLGQGLVPKHGYAPGNFEWSPDDGREIAVVVRLLGLIAFAAGLVERIVISIRHDRATTAL